MPLARQTLLPVTPTIKLWPTAVLISALTKTNVPRHVWLTSSLELKGICNEHGRGWRAQGMSASNLPVV